MVVYLSGINYDTDIQEIDQLKSHLFELDCTVITPVEKELNKLKWSENLQLRLSFLHNSNAIYMLPTWRDSIMARIELTAAMNEKIPLCFSPEDIRELITTLDG
jgi:hypothetical protein